MRFRPTTYEELAELVKDESIYLGDITLHKLKICGGSFATPSVSTLAGLGAGKSTKSAIREVFYDCILSDNPPKWYKDRMT